MFGVKPIIQKLQIAVAGGYVRCLVKNSRLFQTRVNHMKKGGRKKQAQDSKLEKEKGFLHLQYYILSIPHRGVIHKSIQSVLL